MGMSLGNEGSAKSEINVTPLVDVCLVLLIIFMVMTPRKVPEISVRIPPESSQKQPRENNVTDQPLVVRMEANGTVTLNTKRVEMSDLSDQIKQQLEFREKKAVFVDFEESTNYGKAVHVMNSVKRGGADVVALYKKKGESAPQSLTGL